MRNVAQHNFSRMHLFKLMSIIKSSILKQSPKHDTPLTLSMYNSLLNFS